MSKPLTKKILKDFNHPVTKKLIYIHSMETFIFTDMKKASLEKDETKIPTLGPYAAALSYILGNASRSRF